MCAQLRTNTAVLHAFIRDDGDALARQEGVSAKSNILAALAQSAPVGLSFLAAMNTRHKKRLQVTVQPGRCSWAKATDAQPAS